MTEENRHRNKERVAVKTRPCLSLKSFLFELNLATGTSHVLLTYFVLFSFIYERIFQLGIHLTLKVFFQVHRLHLEHKFVVVEQKPSESCEVMTALSVRGNKGE